MIRTYILSGALVGMLALTTGLARAEEPIVGNWKTAAGDTAAIGPCSEGYCVTLKTGKFAGRQIGKFSGSNGNYTGELTDPAANKTYNGTGAVSGNSVKLQGCVLKIFCKSQTWTRL